MDMGMLVPFSSAMILAQGIELVVGGFPGQMDQSMCFKSAQSAIKSDPIHLCGCRKLLQRERPFEGLEDVENLYTVCSGFNSCILKLEGELLLCHDRIEFQKS